MQLLPAFLLTSFLPLATAHPPVYPRSPWPIPDDFPHLTSPYTPATYPSIRTFTYESCEMHQNSRVFQNLPPDKCWDATPNPVYNMARGFGSFKASYRGQVELGMECAIVVYDNRQCLDGRQGKSRVIVIGTENKEECFNVEMGEGVKGFGVEWKCGKVPEV